MTSSAAYPRVVGWAGVVQRRGGARVARVRQWRRFLTSRRKSEGDLRAGASGLLRRPLQVRTTVVAQIGSFRWSRRRPDYDFGHFDLRPSDCGHRQPWQQMSVVQASQMNRRSWWTCRVRMRATTTMAEHSRGDAERGWGRTRLGSDVLALHEWRVRRLAQEAVDGSPMRFLRGSDLERDRDGARNGLDGLDV